MENRVSARWGPVCLIATLLASAPAHAEDFSVTIDEDVLNQFAQTVLPLSGASTHEVAYDFFCMACQAEFQGKCFQWAYETCEASISVPWSWSVISAKFDISPAGLNFTANVKVTFDGETSTFSIQRNGIAYYHPQSDKVVLLLDFLTETKVPIYFPYAGENHYLGSISPYKYFNAIFDIGVANVSMGSQKVMGAPKNIQITHLNNKIRIQSDVQVQ